MPFNKKKNTGTPKRDYTKMKTPHTYAIIFAAIFLCWLLTFLVPAGKFSTHKVEYTDSNGAVKTKTVLMADTFRYSYRLDREAVKDNLTAMSGDEALMESLGVDPAELDAFLETDSSEWTQEDLDELGLTDDVPDSTANPSMIPARSFIRRQRCGAQRISAVLASSTMCSRDW